MFQRIAEVLFGTWEDQEHTFYKNAGIVEKNTERVEKDDGEVVFRTNEESRNVDVYVVIEKNTWSGRERAYFEKLNGDKCYGISDRHARDVIKRTKE